MAGTGRDPLLDARARVLHDLAARGLGSPAHVDVVEDAVQGRRWWLEAWPEGAAYVTGQVAQDVQDLLLDGAGGALRWPLCPACDLLEPHELRVHPELGADPRWVCDRSGIAVSPVGGLG